MPQKKSAEKALRRDKKRYERNRITSKKIKDLRKQAEKAIISKQADTALELYRKLQKLLDKVSRSGGFMKKNTAARYKSHLLKKINALTKK